MNGYRPLIYTICYGRQCYFESLWLMLKSLYVFGRYRGAILVVTDRTEVAVPDEMTDMVHILCRDAMDLATRFQVQEFIGACDVPVLYLDTDIVVTEDVNPILRKIYVNKGIYAASEAALFQEYANLPASAITNEHANWFGLELFLDDPEMRDRRLPCLNSGLFGFSERRIFEQLACQIHKMYKGAKWSSIASSYTEQPFFNYILAKLERFDSCVLSGSLAVVPDAETAVRFLRPFVHFVFASGGEAKTPQMSQYLSYLEAFRGADVAARIEAPTAG